MAQDSGPRPDFALDPGVMTDGINKWMMPVVTILKEVSGRFTQAHAEVAAAHGSQAAGWFGGEGNGEVRPASSSFLNELEYQLRQLQQDQGELAGSFEEYVNALLAHINKMVGIEQRIADRFTAIERGLMERPGQ